MYRGWNHKNGRPLRNLFDITWLITDQLQFESHILAGSSTFSFRIPLDGASRRLAMNIRQMQDGATAGGEAYGEAEAYVVTFFSELLYQREKMKKSLLDRVLPAELQSTWDNLLTTLECNRR